MTMMMIIICVYIIITLMHDGYHKTFLHLQHFILSAKMSDALEYDLPFDYI